VHFVPRRFNLTWPLTAEQAERVLSELLDDFRRVLPAPRPGEGADGRYVFLSEIADRYERCDTRGILERIERRGATPVRPAFGGGEYDPVDEGWGSRPSAAADLGGKPSWGWWRTVREAGPRPLYCMPDPWMGEGVPPVDLALDRRDGTGDVAAYRAALTAAVRADPRQVDCWVHLGNEAFERAARDEAALSEALGYYQTGVAVAELSLPEVFTGVLAWSELDNRPMHRALQGLGLTWWRLGQPAKAVHVFGNSLWTNPYDNQGIRYLIGPARKGTPWSPDEE
jgi:hypothetical protein